MNYDLSLNNRPFKAIQAGTKKVEGRTPKDEHDKRYDQMLPGDTITFTNNITNEQMVCEVLFVNKYANVKAMLEAEGTKNVLSSGLDIEGGIQSYNSLEGYEERIKKYGIYAIRVRLASASQVITFVIDKELEIANHFIGINAYKRNKERGFQQNKNDNLERLSNIASTEEVRKDIEKTISYYYEKEEKLVSMVKDINDEWSKIEKGFMQKLEEVHKFPFPHTAIKGVLSCAGRFGYNTEGKWFATDMFRNKFICMDVAMHELMHFMFHAYYDHACEKEELTKNEMWDVKESFSVLLNLEFKEFRFQPDYGYPPHAKLREVIKESWEKHHDFDIALKSAIEYMKMNRV